MSSAGLSRARLDRMHDVMAGYVERGDVPGLVTLVCRRGEVHVDALGTRAAGGGDPMRRDTIFRISSMTKPIAAVATMILVEEGRLRLDEPVDRLLPELANRRVLKRLDGPIDETVPARRPISVRDLLTMRMGFGFILAPGEYPILRAASEQGIVMGPPNPALPLTPDEWLRRFATLPLMHQPGERWMYELSFAVLGILIARAAGESLEAFLRERIFEPLGMHDTGFSVPAEKLGRLASAYIKRQETGAFELYDGAETSKWSRPPSFPDACNGLVSTVDDYLAFGRMLLNGGEVEGTRILSWPSVELMTTDQLLPGQTAGSEMILGAGRGWGFGVSEVTRPDDVTSVPGRFGWDGGLGTSWYADPNAELTAILMTQVLSFPSGIDDAFWTSVYQALDD
jgi:CubicO group peptidase (beta-lactamase class C family)